MEGGTPPPPFLAFVRWFVGDSEEPLLEKWIQVGAEQPVLRVSEGIEESIASRDVQFIQKNERFQ